MSDLSLFVDPDLTLEEPSQKESFDLEKILGDDAEYLKLYDYSKLPNGSYKPGSENRFNKIPNNMNYGIIPKNRLFIIDFDNHKAGAASIEDQVAAFNKFLETDIRDSLTVVTPSGGLHVYLRLPWSINSGLTKKFPKASLRGYSAAFSEMIGSEIILDADIRSGLSNGYVVAPGSKMKIKDEDLGIIYKEYWIADKTVGFNNTNHILMLNSQQVKKFEKLVETYEKLYFAGRKKRNQRQLIATTDDYNLKDSEPPANVIEKLDNALNKGNRSYHSKRAFVKAGLHCCYTDESIAKSCIKLDIHKDSFTGYYLTFDQVLADLEKFHPIEKYHSKYCDHTMEINNVSGEIIAENSKAFLVKKRDYAVKNYANKFKKHAVVDFIKVLELLESKCKRKNFKPGELRLNNDGKDALAILEVFVNPLLNVGAVKIVLSYDYISKVLGFSKSRINASMRLLRELNILRLADRQKTGLAGTYTLNPDLVDKRLSTALNVMIISHIVESIGGRGSIVFDYKEWCFKDALTGEVLPSVLAGDFLEKKRKTNPLKMLKVKKINEAPVQRYLKNELELRSKDSKILKLVNEDNGLLLS